MLSLRKLLVRFHRAILLVGLATFCCPIAVYQQSKPSSSSDVSVVTTGQRITPAGMLANFSGKVHGVVFGSTDEELWVLVDPPETQLLRLSVSENRVLQRQSFRNQHSGTQSLAFDTRSNQVFFATVAKGVVKLMRAGSTGTAKPLQTLGHNQVGAPAVSGKPDLHGHRLAVVPLTYSNEAVAVDLPTGRIVGRFPTDIAPFAAVLNNQGTVTYISNWGGRRARSGDHTLTSGNPIEMSRADKTVPDPVVVDERGIASTGSVTRIDLRTRATVSIAVGLHPTALAWDELRGRLYVANSNSDSISIINTTTDQVERTINVRPFQQEVPGLAPTALAVDSRLNRLYVACAGINAIAVIDVEHPTFLGLIPTAWYPSSLCLSHDGRRLAVGALLGLGSGWEMSGAVLEDWKREYASINVELPAPGRRYVHSYRGTISVVDVPGPTALANFTAAVAQNNLLTLASASTRVDLAPRPNATPAAIPERVGEPSLIKNIVYIIKENRTYDQLFGDMKKGNGDPSLVMYGPRITPNHHRLADQFVLLDNFYATGGNSGDGHQWATQANETEYTLWPGYAGRSYPYGGDDPIAVARGGFIWDEALRKHQTVRLFGEYVGYGYPRDATPAEITRLRTAAESPDGMKTGKELRRKVAEWRSGVDFSGRWHNVAPNDALNSIMVHDYPAWGIEEIPDVVRAQVFIAYVKRWEQEGTMPNLCIIHLPSDHTEGTSPGFPTPRASVADNDWALGQIVDAISHSRFWKETAIFVVEDDAQGGVDHVDGHRTVALAISPYVRRGAVDSTFYAQQSMLRTIELILGLPPLSIFDLTSTPMRGSFHDVPDFAPYTAVEPQQSLTELNPIASALRGRARRAALQSAKMRFDIIDAAPSEILNQILWHDARGWSTPFPRSPARPFSLPHTDSDDDR
jgi:YVTN family beta-propeller protein